MAISAHNNLCPQFLQWTGEQKMPSPKSCKMLSRGAHNCVLSTPNSSRSMAQNFATSVTSPDSSSLISDNKYEKNGQLLVGGLSGDESIKQHTRKGAFVDAVRVYLDMLENGSNMVDVRSFSVLVKAVGGLYDIELGRQIHGHLLKLGILDDIYVCNSILAMLWKLGAADDAVRMFDKMQKRDSVSWSSMISGFNQSTRHYDALEFLYKMVREFGVYLNRIACLSALSSCGSIRSLIHGQELHAFVIRIGLDMDDFVVNALIHMYMNCGNVCGAQLVFDNTHEILRKNTVLWNVLISGYVDNGCYSEASSVFVLMMMSGTNLDSSTMVTMLVLCSQSSKLALGRQVQALALKFGLEMDVRVKTALIDMYFNCTDAESGLQLFRRSHKCNLVMWGTVISNCARCGYHRETLDLYRDFRFHNGLSDPMMLLPALRACSSLRQKSVGVEIHGLVLKLGLDFDVYVGSALVDMYTECHDVESAGKVFVRLPIKDVVSWNAMLCGYAQNGCVDEALGTFFDMQSHDIELNAVTIATLLSICSHMSTISLCKEIHGYVVRRGFGSNILVSNSLLAAYAECGNMNGSLAVFEKMKYKDKVSWNSILRGLGMHGRVDELFHFFDKMKESGIMPDHQTFTSVLAACSHAGRIEEGFRCFKTMFEEYKLEPKLEQYTCMVDLLGRAGYLNQAYDIIKDMPFLPDDRIWGSLLGSCRIYGEERLAKLASDSIFKLEPASTGYRVLLANLYQDAGIKDEVTRIRSNMKDLGLQKTPGCSWIEVDNQIYTFTVGRHSYPSDEIYDLLQTLTMEMKRLHMDIIVMNYRMLKMSIVAALPRVATESREGDLSDLQQLLVDQPNIPREEVELIYDIICTEEFSRALNTNNHCQ